MFRNDTTYIGSKKMIVMDVINWLKYFIVLNPFLSMFLFMVIGMVIERLYLIFNPNYTLMKGTIK